MADLQEQNLACVLTLPYIHVEQTKLLLRFDLTLHPCRAK